ncbi:MAG TPA: hypothetical protein VHU89_06550 [Acidobacteriaceae bacterium]|nr:hypothetical protein [Acidobacteriaceae bacterium]
MNRLVEDHDVGLVVANALPQIAIDPIDERAKRDAEGGGIHDPRPPLIRADIESGDVGAQAAETAETIFRSLPWTGIADAEDAAMPDLIH